MVHGPCGELNRSSPSMEDDAHEKCTKRYSKPFLNKTVTSEDGYPKYRRRSPEQGGFAAKIKIREMVSSTDPMNRTCAVGRAEKPISRDGSARSGNGTACIMRSKKNFTGGYRTA
ncbi:hypothetical protein EVAR_36759_1 [Eumeta japonica]|uniref:Uncharacterized protein n=1 Tax=Eumeta variegata TaxID=151549 RepID=A0A4C1X087_EUMVA|nr:hypothetical protein EVAR_36759_1 [Eumeta japonica]